MAQGFNQGGDSSFIVGAIKEEANFFILPLDRDQFHPAWPSDVLQSLYQGLRGDMENRFKDFESCQGQAGIDCLMATVQRQGEVVADRPGDRAIFEPIFAVSFSGKIATVEEEGALLLLATCLNHRYGLGCSAGADHRHIGFDDPRLFPGNSFEGCTKVLFVIATDIGDDRHQRRDHIGGVEPPTEAVILETGLLLSKPEQGEDGGELEIGGGRASFEKGCQSGDQFGEIGW